MKKVLTVIGLGTPHANIALGEQVLLNLESLKYLKNHYRQVYKCLSADGTQVNLLINGETVTVQLNEKNIIIYNLLAVYGYKCKLTFESSEINVNYYLSSLSDTHRNHFLNNNVAKYLSMPVLSNQQAMWKGSVTAWQKNIKNN